MVVRSRKGSSLFLFSSIFKHMSDNYTGSTSSNNYTQNNNSKVSNITNVTS